MNLTDRVLQRWRIAKVRPFIAPGSQILDIGSADGALFRQLGRRKGERCLGIDPTLKADIRVDDVPLVAGCFPKDMPAVELPPKALRFVADLLGLMGQRQPVMLMPQKLELSTQEVAAFLNVSRPFVVKQIESGRLACRKVGRHRRVLFEDLLAYQQSLRHETEAALQALADQGQELEI